jgi:hypothetical protein
MRKILIAGSAALGLSATIPVSAHAGTLRGSSSSMKQQHEIAVDEDLTFSRKASQIKHLVDSGGLVAVEGNQDFSLSRVSFPYARPEILLFIQHLAARYHADNGEKLIVTSLVRPTDLQPRNAHKLSVHPAGMAVDFRIPSTASERSWLEKALLGLENAGVLDVTREHTPPHYHVAVFPAEYVVYADAHEKDEAAAKPIDINAIEVITVPPALPVMDSNDREGSEAVVLTVVTILTLMLIGIAPVLSRGNQQSVTKS